MRTDHHVYQLANIYFLQHRRPFRQFTFVIKQLFNQVLQMSAARIKNRHHLFLLTVERADHFVCQQLGAFTQAGKRCFQLMRQMPQELMALRFQPGQPLAQPDDTLSQ